jgi:hypothetical protein
MFAGQQTQRQRAPDSTLSAMSSLEAGVASLQLGVVQTEHAIPIDGTCAAAGTATRSENFFTSAVFADAVSPMLTSADVFALSACARQLHRLRYDWGRWSVALDNYEPLRTDTYESFRVRRYAVPLCFPGATFDLAACLGPRLRVSLHDRHIGNTDALAGVHSLDLSGCTELQDASALGGVHSLNLSRTGIRDVSALGGVHTLGLSVCTNIRDVSALGGVHTLTLSGCGGVRDVSALGGDI